MSLLRRRAMMERKNKYAGTLYVDSGFLNAQVQYDGVLEYNTQYPDAWATTYFPVQVNDVINCEELRTYNADGRIRFYQSNGIQAGYILAGVINIPVASADYIYSRLMELNANAPIPKELTVTHADGTIDIYKIIDRR